MAKGNLSHATIQISNQFDVPAKLLPLAELSGKRYRHYVLYGGRGSGKSWSIARVLLALAVQKPLRILCVREIQNTIADSVHRLLADQIKALGLERFFTVRNDEIEGRNGALFRFFGLRDQDAIKIKSYEGVDICWCEEAHALTERSWRILTPTIRAENSEIWLSFNPELSTDFVYQAFVESKRSDAWVQRMTWQDNPWFPKVLEDERLRLLRTDPDAHDNIWEGNPRAAVDGAIYAREMTQMLQDERVRHIPYDRQLLVHTIWDFGWNDRTAVIFAQRVSSEVRIIDYEEESYLRLDQWTSKLLQRNYKYGGHWLPHDANQDSLAGGGQSIKKQLRNLFAQSKLPGLIRVIPRVPDENVRIRATRDMFPRVYVDMNRCARLLECLRRTRRAKPDSTGEEGAQVKDEYKHGADAFGELARIVDKLSNEAEPKIVWAHRQILNPRIGY
jgi:phage terminase large subunit